MAKYAYAPLSYVSHFRRRRGPLVVPVLRLEESSHDFPLIDSAILILHRTVSVNARAALKAAAAAADMVVAVTTITWSRNACLSVLASAFSWQSSTS